MPKNTKKPAELAARRLTRPLRTLVRDPELSHGDMLKNNASASGAAFRMFRLVTIGFLSGLFLVILNGTVSANLLVSLGDVIESSSCDTLYDGQIGTTQNDFGGPDGAPVGFTPSSNECGSVTTQALVLFSNVETGELWWASTGGWSPGPGWVRGLWPQDCTDAYRNISDGPDDDDDFDGWMNLEEVMDGTDPLDASSCEIGCEPNTSDIDGDLKVMPLTDGILIVRYLFGCTGAQQVEAKRVIF